MFVETKTVVTSTVSITREDLRVMALVLAKVLGTDKRILVIRTLRKAVENMKAVDIYGNPLVEFSTCPNCGMLSCEKSANVPVVWGLKECKVALDSWYVGRDFIG